MVGARGAGSGLLGKGMVLCLSSTNLREETLRLGAMRSVSRWVKQEKAEVSVCVQLQWMERRYSEELG